MKLKLELELSQLNHVLAVLSKQPYDQVHTIIADIMRQASAQKPGGQDATAQGL